MLLHHAGKGGNQRGSSKHEDAVSTTVALKAPEDYEPSEGVRAEIHFEKSREFFGKDTDPFEARLTHDGRGKIEWESRDIKADQDAQIRALDLAGKSQREIAKELGISHTSVYRALKKGKE